LQDIHEQPRPLPHCWGFGNLQSVALLLIPKQRGKFYFVLSVKHEAGRSYYVHLALFGRLHLSAHLILGQKIVAYFNTGLQNVLVQFLMVGTQELSHTCIFLESQKKKTNFYQV
jgi:hypothetical protein